MSQAPTIAVALLLSCGLASPVLADQLVPGGISIEQAIQKAKDAGYVDISKMGVDDGHWEGEGMKGGKHLEFHMDAKTGALSNEHPDD